MEWFIYIPEEGDWGINYSGNSARIARQAYLEAAKLKRLPTGSKIWSRSIDPKAVYVVMDHLLKDGETRRKAVFNRMSQQKVRNKAGHVRTFPSTEPAQAFADKLNRAEANAIADFLVTNRVKRRRAKMAKGYDGAQRRTNHG